MGGVKWEINPHVREKDKVVCLSDRECSYPPEEGPSLPVEGWHHTLKRSKPELTANAQGCASLKKGVTCKPPKFPNYHLR